MPVPGSDWPKGGLTSPVTTPGFHINTKKKKGEVEHMREIAIWRWATVWGRETATENGVTEEVSVEGRLEGKWVEGRLGVVGGELAIVVAHSCSPCFGLLRDTTWSGPRSYQMVCKQNIWTIGLRTWVCVDSSTRHMHLHVSIFRVCVCMRNWSECTCPHFVWNSRSKVALEGAQQQFRLDAASWKCFIQVAWLSPSVQIGEGMRDGKWDVTNKSIFVITLRLFF